MMLTSKKLLELRRELYFIKKKTVSQDLSLKELRLLAAQVNYINELLLAKWIEIKKQLKHEEH